MAMTAIQFLIVCTALQRVEVDAAPGDFLEKNHTDAAAAKLPQTVPALPPVSGYILWKNGTTPALPQAMLEWSQNDPTHASLESTDAAAFRQCNTLSKRTLFTFRLITQCPLLAAGTIAGCVASIGEPLLLAACLGLVAGTPLACHDAVNTGCGDLESKCCRCETKDEKGCLFEGFQGNSCDDYCKKTVEDHIGRYPSNYKFRHGATCEAARRGSTYFHGLRNCTPADPLKCCRCQTDDEKGCLGQGIQGYSCDSICKKLVDHSSGRYPGRHPHWNSQWAAYKFHGSCETAKKEEPFSRHEACILSSP